MEKTLLAKVDDNFEFNCNLDEVSTLDISSISKKEQHLLFNNKSYLTKIIASNFNTKTYKVSVNNTIYTVNIHNELNMLINEMGFSRGAKKAITSINAPMPGLIIEINVEVGQNVKENDMLLILEAMKMENSITSPIDGKIKSINVKKGDAVEKNQLIIEFE